MTGTQIMLPLVVLYSLTMFGSIGGGWFPVYFINKGYNPYDGRLRAMLMIAVIPIRKSTHSSVHTGQPSLPQIFWNSGREMLWLTNVALG